tara:strand:+ start:386 stop:688 length:303 start_codon:yes stop_codon:yes gene_type:complete
MKKTINFYDFRDAFHKFGRGDQFTNSGLRTIFDYIEEYEDSADEEVEFDVIAICCEYSEYDSIADFWLEYDQEDYPDMDSIEYDTTVIMIDEEAFIIEQF